MNSLHLISNQKAAEPINYIRIRSPLDARFIEFDFAIGDPTLFVELVMPPEAFTAFCQKNQVVEMSVEQQKQVDAEIDKWRYGEDSLMATNRARKQALTDNNNQQD